MNEQKLYIMMKKTFISFIVIMILFINFNHYIFAFSSSSKINQTQNDLSTFKINKENITSLANDGISIAAIDKNDPNKRSVEISVPNGFILSRSAKR